MCTAAPPQQKCLLGVVCVCLWLFVSVVFDEKGRSLGRMVCFDLKLGFRLADLCSKPEISGQKLNNT